MRTLEILLVAGLVISARADAADARNLDWMAGSWCSEQDGESIEENWTKQKGGLMLGVNRTVSPGRTGFEFLRIEFSKDEVTYVAQPGGGAPTRFAAYKTLPNEVSFANPDNGYPKRIHYRREGEELTASIDGGADGLKEMRFRWSQCRSRGL